MQVEYQAEWDVKSALTLSSSGISVPIPTGDAPPPPKEGWPKSGVLKAGIRDGVRVSYRAGSCGAVAALIDVGQQPLSSV